MGTEGGGGALAEETANAKALRLKGACLKSIEYCWRGPGGGNDIKDMLGALQGAGRGVTSGRGKRVEDKMEEKENENGG